ncbi:MAG: transglycosylase domain-containing protein [Acidobacteria bacterium]|nr:transglycosylase domain-containing protein [Acidobacteriota bacterium]
MSKPSRTCFQANRVCGGGDASRGVLEARQIRYELRFLNWKKLLGPGMWILVAFLVAVLVVCELRTSALQAQVLSFFSRRMTYVVAPGPSDAIVFPKGGPYDEQLGYTRIPEFQQRLGQEGYHVREQARFTEELLLALRLGLNPPYREPAEAGLLIRSSEGNPLYRASEGNPIFADPNEIPPLVVSTLLFIENRELGRAPADCRANPVIDWNRLAKAAGTYLGAILGLPVRVQGGSTLATQIEKYRHSPRGRTGSVPEKLRQMLSASLKVYGDGVDACDARRRIIVDYLNSVPLGAVPGYGEVHGLGQGLYAWFGVNLHDACERLRDHEETPSSGVPRAKAPTYKQVLTLLYAARAPSYYLAGKRDELEAKVNAYVRLMAREGLISEEFGREVEAADPAFAPRAAAARRVFSPQDKAAASIRTSLLRALGVPGFYEIDRLHLEVDSTIDEELQKEAARILTALRDPGFLASNGLFGERLLSQGEPAGVNYSVLLFERRPEGNLLRVQSDTLEQPFDVNDGVKMQLGSTAKLRTLVHYLEIVASLHDELSRLERPQLAERARLAKDPITRWAAQTLAADPHITLDAFLEKALERRYSASPYETFFTGGGLHAFANFDPADNGRVLSVREGLVRSVNLVFIRLMRDLVLFHRSRLPYDAEAVLKEPGHPERRPLLEQATEAEARHFLLEACETYRGLSPEESLARLLGPKGRSLRNLAILGLAWHSWTGSDPERVLAQWFADAHVSVRPEEIRRLALAYGDPRLNLADQAYLLRVHPLELWCAVELGRNPGLSWEDLWGRSGEARRAASSWLFQTRNRRAQDLRLRARIEEDAFERMLPYWKRLGFPFDRLVPSLATAIGSSSDRPAALAELMGIIVNDGVRRPALRVRNLRFAPGTPYHTVLEAAPAPGGRVMHPAVARFLREVLAAVVQKGTARRVAGAFAGIDRPEVNVGGKTGSGDNRFVVFGQGGARLAERPVDRTATFVFYIGDRYFGVITACVQGRAAENYRFTSALPVTVLKLLAPAINRRLSQAGVAPDARAAGL